MGLLKRERERERERIERERGKRRERIKLFVLFNVVVYVILISCI